MGLKICLPISNQGKGYSEIAELVSVSYVVYSNRKGMETCSSVRSAFKRWALTLKPIEMLWSCGIE